jgi:hypothetical protein
LNTAERKFLRVVDESTRGLNEYDRGVTSVFALAAFRTGYRYAQEQAQSHNEPHDHDHNAGIDHN